MKITLTGEESLRLEPTFGPLTIEAESHDPELLSISYARQRARACTLSVIKAGRRNKDIRRR